jgi:hypothetical protein
MTFDERVNRTRPRGFSGAKPLVKSSTFSGKVIQAQQSLNLDDALYRRFFNNRRRAPSLSRGQSFKEMKRVPSDLALSEEAGTVVVVDTFSTGAMLAHELMCQNYKVICVLSGEGLEHLLEFVPKGINLTFEATIAKKSDMSISELAEQVKAVGRVSAVFPGAETGVELADALSQHLGLRTNGTTLSEARRNKYVMGETVRSAGVRAVKQLKATKWSDIKAYLEEWQPDPFKVIVKPIDSAGSDGVTLCRSMEEARTAFGDIIGKTNVLGLVNESVLVQEYLEGQEYVIDMVSKDGEHKVVAVWAYDRRPANGAHFVAFGQRLLTVDDEHVKELIAYQRRVCTALGILNGPSHGEVKWFKGEPVLVEVGARCHGAEGLWCPVANAVYGYNQVQCTAMAYMDEKKYAALPSEVSVRNAYGRIAFLVNYTGGVIKDFNRRAFEDIEAMDSFIALELFVNKGDEIRPTKDCLSWVGVVKLSHTNLTKLVFDYEQIRVLEAEGLFVMR